MVTSESGGSDSTDDGPATGWIMAAAAEAAADTDCARYKFVLRLAPKNVTLHLTTVAAALAAEAAAECSMGGGGG